MDTKRYKKGNLPKDTRGIVIFKKKKSLNTSLLTQKVIKDILCFYERNDVSIVGFYIYKSDLGEEGMFIAYNPAVVNKDVLSEVTNSLIGELFDEKKVSWNFCLSIEWLMPKGFYILQTPMKGFSIRFDEKNTPYGAKYNDVAGS